MAEAAQRLQLDLDEVKRQEQEQSDLPLSALYRWQKLLGASAAELLVDGNDPLAMPGVRRERLIQVLNSAFAILAGTKQPAVRRLAHTLVDQIVELAPELSALAKSHSAGRRQRLDEQGRAVQGPLPVDIFLEPIE